MLSVTPISLSMSRIVNPRSAMMDIPGLSSIVFKKPDSRVSSTSEIEPTNTGDMYEIAPLGVQATRNLEVLCCLYWLHVDDCKFRSDGVSKKTSLRSIYDRVSVRMHLSKRVRECPSYLLYSW